MMIVFYGLAWTTDKNIFEIWIVSFEFVNIINFIEKKLKTKKQKDNPTIMTFKLK